MLLHSFLLPLMKTTLLVLKLTLRLNNSNSNQAKNKGNAVVDVDVVMAMVMAMVTATAMVAHMLVALEVSDSSLELLMRAKEDVTEVKEVENGNSLLAK